MSFGIRFLVDQLTMIWDSQPNGSFPRFFGSLLYLVCIFFRVFWLSIPLLMCIYIRNTVNLFRFSFRAVDLFIVWLPPGTRLCWVNDLAIFSFSDYTMGMIMLTKTSLVKLSKAVSSVRFFYVFGINFSSRIKAQVECFFLTLCPFSTFEIKVWQQNNTGISLFKHYIKGYQKLVCESIY